MTQKEKHERAEKKQQCFRQITDEMANLYEKKNADYGDSFGDTYRRLGLASPVSRILDKCNRICNLAVNKGGQQIKDESLEDNLIDLANYAIMTLIELREEEAENHNH